MPNGKPLTRSLLRHISLLSAFYSALSVLTRSELSQHATAAIFCISANITKHVHLFE